jgi:signal transduction histidine kinase
LKLEQKIMLYRVLQELISNTFKYADADNVRIKYSFIKNDLLFEYEDDGKGFDLVHVKKGVGLDSIRSRVEFYKGSLKYEAAPGRGMTAVILLPVAE